jgi:hypothetical protein
MKKFLLAALLLSTPVEAQNYNPGQIVATVCSATNLGAATALTVIQPNTVPHGWRLQNLDTTEALWWSVTGVAAINPATNTTASFALAAGTAVTFAGSGTAEPGYGFGTGGALSIIATTAAHKYACIYW